VAIWSIKYRKTCGDDLLYAFLPNVLAILTASTQSVLYRTDLVVGDSSGLMFFPMNLAVSSLLLTKTPAITFIPMIERTASASSAHIRARLFG